MAASGHVFLTPTYTGLGVHAGLAGPAVNLDTHIDDLLRVLYYEDRERIAQVDRRLPQPLQCFAQPLMSAQGELTVPQLHTRVAQHPRTVRKIRRARTLGAGLELSRDRCLPQSQHHGAASSDGGAGRKHRSSLMPPGLQPPPVLR